MIVVVFPVGDTKLFQLHKWVIYSNKSIPSSLQTKVKEMVAGRHGSVLKAYYMYGAGRKLENAEEKARTAPTNEQVA